MPTWLTAELAGDLGRGVAVTVVLTLVTSVGAVGVGLAAAIGRRSKRAWARWTAGAFVEIFRNVPALILLIFFAFAVPNIFALLAVLLSTVAFGLGRLASSRERALVGQDLTGAGVHGG